MDDHRKEKTSGGISSEFQSEMLSSPAKAIWEDLIAGQNKEEEEEDNISLQWLSIFMEDCLSSTTNFTSPSPLIQTKTTSKPQSFQHFSVPSKPRNKRRKTKTSSELTNFTDSPLLHQPHWLAESELFIAPKMAKDVEPEAQAEKKGNGKGRQQQQPKRCSHCLSQKTPQWRAGPMGPKTLCNACGVRFKSGRLFPEYRPAKSPTFVSYKHSNSHKKVMEMRTAVFSHKSD